MPYLIAGNSKGLGNTCAYWLGSTWTRGCGERWILLMSCNRRSYRVLPILLPYLELVLSMATLIALVNLAAWSVLAWNQLLDMPFVTALMWIKIAAAIFAILVFIALAYVGVILDWPWLVRWILYGVWFVSFMRFVAHHPAPWYVETVVYGGALVLLAQYVDRRRQQKAP